MDAAYPSKYLKASDLEDRQVRALMSHVAMENIGDNEPKPVLYFSKSTLKDPANKVKGLVLNKTNKNAIKASYGKNSEEWEGKEIILFVALVDFRGDQVEAIRVRTSKPIKTPPPPPPIDTENPGQDLEDTF
jgi:hypothetical protein